MARVHRVSLRTRLAAVAGLGAMVVLTAGALLLYRDISGDLSTAITDGLDIRVSDLAIDFEDNEVSAGPGLVLSQAVDENGNVISPPGAEQLLTADELARASQGQIIVSRGVAGLNRHARLLARPIGMRGGDVVVGASAVSTAELVQARQRLTAVLAFAGPALAALIGATVWIMTGAALRPVRRMASEAATISMDQAGHRLPQPAGDDEIAELGRTLNAMLTRIEDTITRERAFIDDAAHELRTPIAVVRGEIELALSDVADRSLIGQGLASALEETDRLTHLTEGLLTLARADAGQLVPGDATTELLDTAQTAVGRVTHRDELTIEVRGEPTMVRGDEEWICQILINLVANAERYATARIVITADVADGQGRLVVADDGPGFPDELLPRAFDRFARGDQARGRSEGGAGLGLAITESLARALGGTVRAANGSPLGGACVQVTLPLAVP